METKMCVLCFNSQWRSVVVGIVSCVISLFLLFLTIGYNDVIQDHLESKLAAKRCYRFQGLNVNWTRTLETKENDCMYLAFRMFYPWPLWILLGTYGLLNASLVVSAVYK